MALAGTSVPAAMILTAGRAWRAFLSRRTAPAGPVSRWGPAGPRPCTCLFCLCNEIDPTAMAAHPRHLADSTGCRWLMLAAEMAGLANGSWRSLPHPAQTGWDCLPRIATCALRAEDRSVGAARDFTFATLRRWGTAHSSQDIAVVVSELVTNTLRHALPGLSDTSPRGPVRLGLLQHGPLLLCAVADPSKAAPAPRPPDSLAESGRGLLMIRALSDQWGYTRPSDAGKVVWAIFTVRHTAPSLARYPAGQAATEHREQHGLGSHFALAADQPPGGGQVDPPRLPPSLV